MLDWLRAMEEGAYGSHEKRIRHLEAALDRKAIDNIKATSVSYPTPTDSCK
jgi:hypothetical protein